MKASFLAAIVTLTVLSASFDSEAKALTDCQLKITDAVLAQAKTDWPSLDVSVGEAPDTSQQESGAMYCTYNVPVYQTTHEQGRAFISLLANYRVGVNEVCGLDVQPIEH